jgi:hypothetical protein
MRFIARLTFMTIAGLCATRAMGHGFGLSLNDNNGTPVSFNVSSQNPFLDQSHVTESPSNLFLEEFGGTPFSDVGGTYYSTIHGFAQTAGPWPPFTATFSVVSPLYFADGTSVAATPAQDGTYIDIFDLWAGNPQPTTNPHPGAAFGDVFVNGTTSYYPGFGVSLFDAHELEKDLYIGAGATYGAYGFAYVVTAHFANGTTLTSPVLVDVFAMSDPATGDFAANASIAQQDAATTALYKAAMADVNFDGIVNGQDIALTSSNWLATGNIGQLPGDANRDGLVNGQDIALISASWEASGGGLGAASAAAVPEPTTLVLVVASLAILLGRSTCRTREASGRRPPFTSHGLTL